MARFAWFTLGFLAAMMIAAALIMGPLQQVLAVGTRAVAPTLSHQIKTEPTALPSPTPPQPLLLWQRQSGLQGSLAALEIEADWDARYTPDGVAWRLAYLTAEERDMLDGWRHQYGSFGLKVYQGTEGLAGADVWLQIEGQGKNIPSTKARTEIAEWAAQVYQRMLTQEQQGDLIASARLALAGEMGCVIEDIEVLAVTETVWRDACLEIYAPELFCAAVATPGYRIEMLLAGQRHEFRSDLHGLLKKVTTE